MKKISVILGALALGCVAMLTSCNNGAQDVVDVASYSYIYDVTDVTIEKGEAAKEWTFVTTKAYGYVNWNESGNSNYQSYGVTLNGIEYSYKVGDTTITNPAPSGYLSIPYITKIDDAYYVLDGNRAITSNADYTITVDGDLEDDEFTLKVAYSTDNYRYDTVKSFSATFTRK